MTLSRVIFTILLPFALSQDTTTTVYVDPSSSASSTTTSQAFTTTIAVGKANHAFEPNVVQVPVGGFVGGCSENSGIMLPAVADDNPSRVRLLSYKPLSHTRRVSVPMCTL
jgi:hypothetical protein